MLIDFEGDLASQCGYLDYAEEAYRWTLEVRSKVMIFIYFSFYSFFFYSLQQDSFCYSWRGIKISEGITFDHC